MSVKVTKWGNSMGVRVPAAMAASIGIRPGTTVDLVLEDGAVKIVPAKKRVRRKLAQLLAGIRKSNLHGETATGHAVGAEVLE